MKKFYVLRQAHNAGSSHLQQDANKTFSAAYDAIEWAKAASTAAATYAEYVVVAEYARVSRQVSVVVTPDE